MNTIAAPKRRIKLSLDTFDFMFIAANAIVRNHNSINSTGIFKPQKSLDKQYIRLKRYIIKRIINWEYFRIDSFESLKTKKAVMWNRCVTKKHPKLSIKNVSSPMENNNPSNISLEN